MQETWVQSLGWEDPLEKGAATLSSILAWRIPWTVELGRLYSPWGHKELYTTDLLSHTHTHTHTQFSMRHCSVTKLRLKKGLRAVTNAGLVNRLLKKE